MVSAKPIDPEALLRRAQTAMVSAIPLDPEALLRRVPQRRPSLKRVIRPAPQP